MSIKLEDAIARQIERDMKEFNYTTKTEFIRESIRDKLKRLDEEREKRKAWQALYSTRGIFKGKGKAKTDKEWVEWRKDYGEKLAQELAKKYDVKI